MKKAVMTGKLTRHEYYNIRLHKMCAKLFFCFETCWVGIREFVLLFSKKTRAMRLLRTGEIFEFQGETDVAIDYFEQALGKYPKLIETHLNLCRCYLRLLSLKKAREHCLKYMEKEPDSPEINLYMGVILYYGNKWDDALVHLSKAEERLPAREKKKASAFEYMGECYLKLGNPEEAVTCLERSIQVNPYGGGEKKYVSLGEGYYMLGKKEEALRIFKKALEMNQRNHEAWNNIGVLMWSVNNLESAYKCFRKSLDINPEYREAQTNLVSVEEGMRSVMKNGRNITKSFPWMQQ
ncbi:MAG: tetratricopeptide repeat protein [Nitrospiraceae bacterium]|nr:MAG: tetratricopeptide repeat protein [Nitrospiraceae bacterium]